MKTHTVNFKNEIKKFGRQIDSKITYTINGITTILGGEQLYSVTPVYEGALLKSIMKELDISCNVNIPIGTELEYQFGLLVGNDYEYINFGQYIVYSVEKQKDTESYNIVCYDKMLYSMTTYKKPDIIFPCTIRDYIIAICSDLNIEFKNYNETFANYDKILTKDVYEGINYSYRDVLDELAQVTASIIYINIDNKLEIKYITETNDTINEEYLKDTNVNIGELFGPINTIVLSRSADSDSIYYPEPLPQNPIEFKISDNQIMNGNDRSTFMPDIYNKLNGLQFYTNSLSSTGICYYDIGDRYTISIENNTYSCVMLNDEILITQGLEENIDTEMPEQTVTNYSKSAVTDLTPKTAYLIVDKKLNEIEASVSDVYTKEEVQKIADGSFQNVKVSYIATEQGKFDSNGLTIQKVDGNDTSIIISETSTLFNEDGLKVRKVADGQISTDKPILFSGYVKDNTYGEIYKGHSITATNNIIVDKYFVIGDKARMEQYTQDGVTKTGVFPL